MTERVQHRHEHGHRQLMATMKGIESANTSKMTPHGRPLPTKLPELLRDLIDEHPNVSAASA